MNPHSRRSIDEFLALRRIAVVGVSRDEKQYSRLIFREFRDRGYDVVPVNPAAEEIDGLRAYARVTDVQPPVEGAMVILDAGVPDALKDCAAAGVRRVWVRRKMDSWGHSLCGHNGIVHVDGECPFMFLPETGFPHAAHRIIRTITRSMPR